MNEKYKDSTADTDVPVEEAPDIGEEVTCANEEPVNSDPEATDTYLRRYCATDRVYTKITERRSTNLAIETFPTRILQENSPTKNFNPPLDKIGCYKSGQLLLIHPLLKSSQPLGPAWCSFFAQSSVTRTYRICNPLNDGARIHLIDTPGDRTLCKPTSVLIWPEPVQLNALKSQGSSHSASKRIPQRKPTKWKGTTLQTPSEELSSERKNDVCKLFTTPTQADNYEEYLSQLTRISSRNSFGTGNDSKMAKTLATPEMYNTLAVCQNCGVKSKNLSFCDSCKRAIPKNAKHMPDTDMTQPAARNTSTSTPNIEQKFGKKRDHIEDDKQKQYGTAKRKKLDSKPDSPKPGSSMNNATQSVNSGAKPEKLLDLNASRTVICGPITEQDEQMFRAKNQIQTQLKDKSSVSAEVSCRSVRLGTYRSIGAGDPKDENNIIVKFTKAGIMFEMPHYKEPATRIELVIPRAAILYSGATTNSKSLSFVVVRTGIRIAGWMSKRLGIEATDEVKFMPTSRVPCEQNVVFYAWEFSNEAKAAIKMMPAIRILTMNEANELLQKIALPGTMSCAPEFPRPSTVRRKLSKPPTTPKEKSPVPIKKTIKVKDVNSGNNTVIKETKSIATKTISTIVAAQSFQSVHANKQILRKGKFTLFVKDLDSAKPGEFLNDQIIDFWLEHMLENILSEADRKRTHLFSTFYYNRLTQKESGKGMLVGKKLTPAEKRHARVKNWTKKVDIFSKDFIIVPINENCHWYVAIICFPGLDGPQWVSDGTPVEGWRNIGYRNGRPVYELPPGMVARTDDLPPWRKELLESDISRAKKGVPLISGESSGTPIEKMNGETSADEAKISKTNATTTIIQVNGRISKNDSGQKVVVTMSQGVTPKKPEVVLKCFTSSKTGSGELLLKDEFSDFESREEADPDQDEDSLFEDYYISDSEDNEREEDKTAKINGDIAPESVANVEAVKEESGEQLIDHKAEAKVETESVVTPQEEVKEENTASMSDQMPLQNERTDFRIRQPCILVFDSLSSGIPKSKVYGTLREYLEMEHKVRKGSTKEFSKYTMPGFMANCPQQPNYSDCGVYLLQYVEQFFKTPLDSYLLALPYSLRKWFTDLTKKRREIYDAICDLVKTENPEDLKLIPPFDTPQTRTPKAENKTSIPKDPAKDKSAKKLIISNQDTVPEAACFVSTPDPSPDMSPSKLVSDSLASIQSQVSETIEDTLPAEEVNVPPLPCETLNQIVQIDHNYNSETTEFSEPKDDEEQSTEPMETEVTKFDVPGIKDQGADICSFREVHFSPMLKLENVVAAEEPMDIDV